MKLYVHPFSSYCQKALIALYENATPFEYCNIEEPAAGAGHYESLLAGSVRQRHRPFVRRFRHQR